MSSFRRGWPTDRGRARAGVRGRLPSYMVTTTRAAGIRLKLLTRDMKDRIGFVSGLL